MGMKQELPKYIAALALKLFVRFNIVFFIPFFLLPIELHHRKELNNRPGFHWHCCQVLRNWRAVPNLRWQQHGALQWSLSALICNCLRIKSIAVEPVQTVNPFIVWLKFRKVYNYYLNLAVQYSKTNVILSVLKLMAGCHGKFRSCIERIGKQNKNDLD